MTADPDDSVGEAPDRSDERVDRLFTLPPGDFVAERDALVKQLRSSDRRDVARRVAELRRPTLPAWAVNQAVRAEPDAYADLRRAGDRMRQALRRAMSGVGDADVGSATRQRRERVQALTETALAHLRDAGHDVESHREAVAATFDAASADDGAGDRVGAGRLSRPLERPSEFGELSPLALLGEQTESPEDGQGDGDAQGDARPTDTADSQEAARRAAVRAARGRTEQARAAAAAARRGAEKAEQEAEAAEQDARDAQARLEQARRDHEQAQARAERTRHAADRARQQARAAVEAAERRAAELADLTDAGGAD